MDGIRHRGLGLYHTHGSLWVGDPQGLWPVNQLQPSQPAPLDGVVDVPSYSHGRTYVKQSEKAHSVGKAVLSRLDAEPSQETHIRDA